MVPLSEYIAGLKRNQFDLKFALERDLRLEMEAAAKLAKSFIGQEMPGWDPLKPATLVSKERGGYATPAPLKRTGELAESMKSEAESTYNGVRGMIYSEDPTAFWHEYGTSKMAARPFLGPALVLSETAIGVALGALAVRTLTQVNAHDHRSRHHRCGV